MIWCLTVECREYAAAEIYGDLLEQISTAITLFEASNLWRVQAYCEEQPNLNALQLVFRAQCEKNGFDEPSMSLEILPEKDWVAENQASFPPLQIAGFYIFGSHVTTSPPNDYIPLMIDAAVAFGTGEHDTTSGCLTMMRSLQAHQYKRCLDLGTGTGILAMAAVRLWNCSVEAADIDDASVRVAQENFQLNHIEGVSCYQSDGFEKIQGSFDLIIANILAGPLCDMALEISNHMEHEGNLILSGILTHQANMVIDAYVKNGLELLEHNYFGEWSVLLLRKP